MMITMMRRITYGQEPEEECFYDEFKRRSAPEEAKGRLAKVSIWRSGKLAACKKLATMSTKR